MYQRENKYFVDHHKSMGLSLEDIDMASMSIYLGDHTSQFKQLDMDDLIGFSTIHLNVGDIIPNPFSKVSSLKVIKVDDTIGIAITDLIQNG